MSHLLISVKWFQSYTQKYFANTSVDMFIFVNFLLIHLSCTYKSLKAKKLYSGVFGVAGADSGVRFAIWASCGAPRSMTPQGKGAMGPKFEFGYFTSKFK